MATIANIKTNKKINASIKNLKKENVYYSKRNSTIKVKPSSGRITTVKRPITSTGGTFTKGRPAATTGKDKIYTIDGIKIKMTPIEIMKFRYSYRARLERDINRILLLNPELKNEYLEYRNKTMNGNYDKSKLTALAKKFLEKKGYKFPTYDQVFNDSLNKTAKSLKYYITNIMQLDYKDLTVEEIYNIKNSRSFRSGTKKTEPLNYPPKTITSGYTTVTINGIKIKVLHKEFNKIRNDFLKNKKNNRNFNYTWKEYLNKRLETKFNAYKRFLSEELNLSYDNFSLDQNSNLYNSIAFENYLKRPRLKGCVKPPKKYKTGATKLKI